jgi:hypothetical protein
MVVIIINEDRIAIVKGVCERPIPDYCHRPAA